MKVLPEFENYSATEDGSIYSNRTGGRMKESERPDGYLVINLRKGGKTYCRRVHRLVASAFIEQTGPHINHKDRNRSNNRVDNLEWVTQKENNIHSYENVNHGNYKGAVISKGLQRLTFTSRKLAAEHIGCHPDAIRHVETGKRNSVFGWRCKEG